MALPFQHHYQKKRKDKGFVGEEGEEGEGEEGRLMRDEIGLGEEGGVGAGGDRRFGVSWKRVVGWRWLEYVRSHLGQLLMVLLITLLGVNLVVTAEHTRNFVRTQRVSPKTRPLSYGSDAKYMSLDKKYDALWDELRPDNGLVSLPPWSSDGKSIAGHYGHISMLHHLHCLAILRNALQRSYNGEEIGLDHSETELHWPHCLYYMRQAILCAADGTIEYAHYDNGTVELTALAPSFIDGRLDVRQCGDSEALMEMRRQHGINAHST